MRGLIFSFLSVALLLGCEEKEKIKEMRIDSFFSSFFGSHKKALDNKIFEDEANDDLIDTLPSMISKGLLDEYVLEFVRLNEYKKGNYAAHFSGWHYDKTTFHCSFDIVALVDEHQARELINKRKYLVSGHFREFLHDNSIDYISSIFYTDEVKMKHDEVYTEKPAFFLGIMLLDRVQIKEAPPSEVN